MFNFSPSNLLNTAQTCGAEIVPFALQYPENPRAV